MSKALHKTLQAKMAALQGPEWDSSDEEGAAQPVVTEKKFKKKSSDKKSKHEKKRSKVDPIKLGKKQKDEDSDEEGNEDDLVLYIGHLPKEFDERDLIKFLSQFGKVYNCRIARKLQTGNSKGYAFVRFGDAEVASIVCDTLHGYFIGQQRLVCQLRPGHKGMFFNTDTVIAKRRLDQEVAKKKRNQSLANLEKLKQITSKLVSREQKKRKQLEAMGIDYDFPGYEQNKAEFQEQFAGQESVEQSRKRSDSAGSEGSAKKKKKRKDSVDSEGSAKKKKKRKNSVDEEADDEKRERSLSVESEGSAKKSKRKGSIDSESSAKKKKKRKDSVDSEGSAKKKRKHSDASDVSTETPKKSNASKERQTKTAVKKGKTKKDRKRRESAP